MQNNVSPQNGIPKYRLIEEYIKGYISDRKLKGGSLLPSENEIARLMDVHPNTVKFALNNLVNEGLIYRQQGKGTFVAHRTAANERRDIDGSLFGVIVSDVCRESICPAIVRGIEDVTCESGINILLGNSDNDFDKLYRYVEQFEQQNVSGLMLMLPQTDVETHRNYELVSGISRKGMPLVLIDRYLKGIPVDYVTTDNERGGFALTSHLLELGHRQIAYICESFCSTIEERIIGYKMALASAGVPYREELTVKTGLRLEEAGLEGVRTLIRNDVRFSAVICANDSVAHGAYEALTSMGMSIPIDVSLTGYDDSPIPEGFDVPLTTVRQPAYEMGRVAASLCIERLNGERDEPKGVVLSSELLTRASTLRVCHAGTKE